MIGRVWLHQSSLYPSFGAPATTSLPALRGRASPCAASAFASWVGLIAGVAAGEGADGPLAELGAGATGMSEPRAPSPAAAGADVGVGAGGGLLVPDGS